MTNEEKALDIIFGWADDVQECAKDAAMEMAEWKDQQFKEYLERRKAKDLLAYEKDHASIDIEDALTIDEIINELFPKTEPDNSDKEE